MLQIPEELLYKDDRGRHGIAAAISPMVAVEIMPKGPFLSPKHVKQAVLAQKTAVSHDVTCFRFALEHEQQVLGLPTGKHMLIRKKWTNKEGHDELVMRAYTPTTANETLGHFDLIVKIYKANVHPRFPDGGKFSQVRAAPGSTRSTPLVFVGK
jgi:hypothetical protein